MSRQAVDELKQQIPLLDYLQAQDSPIVRTTNTSSSIATRSLVPKWSISWTPAEFLPCGRATGVRGKTESPNAGFETSATNYSTM